MAVRSGPVHEFLDPDDAASFLAANPTTPDPGAVSLVARDAHGLPARVGSLKSWEVRDGALHVSAEWDDALESRHGDRDTYAHPVFDDAGRLIRVVIEEDEEGDEAGSPDDESGSSDSLDIPSSLTSSRPTDPAAMAGRSTDPTTPSERPAAMASRDAQRNDDHDDDSPVDLTQPPRKAAPKAEPPEEPAPSVEEIRAELERTKSALAKANKSDKERRLRLDELEEAERQRAEANISESEKIARAKADAEKRAAQAEQRAAERDRQLEEIKLERLVESEARKQRFTNPELAYRLVDRTLIERDADLDRWDGIPRALEALAKQYPNLIAQKSAGPGSPPRDEFPGNPHPRGRNGANGRLSGRSGNEDIDPFAAYANDKVNYERM